MSIACPGWKLAAWKSGTSVAGCAWRQQSAHFHRGLSAAVAAKFDEWGLTEAESDIAGLILKGVSPKAGREAARSVRGGDPAAGAGNPW